MQSTVKNFLFLIPFLFLTCKKTEEPKKEIPDQNYFIMANDYYETPNAYLIPFDTLYTYAINYLYLSDGMLDTTNATIKNYKQLLFIDLNTEISDSSLQGEFTMINEGREAQTFSSAKIIIAELGTQLIAKNGRITFEDKDSLIRIDYNFTFPDNSIISGNYEGEIDIKRIDLKKQELILQ